MVEDPEASARASLFRSLIVYTALLAADIAVISFIVSSGVSGGAYVSLSIVGIVGLLLGYQVLQHYRDTRTPLAEAQGFVQRKWKRADLVIAWQSYYITMGRTVYRLSPELYLGVEEGMYVKVVHFPNTLNVVTIHRIPPPAPEPDASI